MEGYFGKIYIVENITVIVPILNEAKNIPSLLECLNSQTLQPHEVIFIDSGSIDNSLELISNFSTKNIRFTIRIEINSGGLPGGNRNKGVILSANPWIAFIDAGITPCNHWIETLWNTTVKTGSKAVFGMCQFNGTSAFSQAVCAISYGCTNHSVIPASLFHKDIFYEIGFFPDHLRAGEDVLWLQLFDRRYSFRVSTNVPVAAYDTFPNNFHQLLFKYWSYEKNLIRANLGKFKALCLGFLFVTIAFITAVSTVAGLVVLLTYILIRGVIDPIRRCRSIFWWKFTPFSLLLAPLCALIIDLTITACRLTNMLSRKCL